MVDGGRVDRETGAPTRHAAAPASSERRSSCLDSPGSSPIQELWFARLDAPSPEPQSGWRSAKRWVRGLPYGPQRPWIFALSNHSIRRRSGTSRAPHRAGLLPLPPAPPGSSPFQASRFSAGRGGGCSAPRGTSAGALALPFSGPGSPPIQASRFGADRGRSPLVHPSRGALVGSSSLDEHRWSASHTLAHIASPAEGGAPTIAATARWRRSIGAPQTGVESATRHHAASSCPHTHPRARRPQAERAISAPSRHSIERRSATSPALPRRSCPARANAPPGPPRPTSARTGKPLRIPAVFFTQSATQPASASPRRVRFTPPRRATAKPPSTTDLASRVGSQRPAPGVAHPGAPPPAAPPGSPHPTTPSSRRRDPRP